MLYYTTTITDNDAGFTPAKQKLLNILLKSSAIYRSKVREFFQR